MKTITSLKASIHGRFKPGTLKSQYLRGFQAMPACEPYSMRPFDMLRAGFSGYACIGELRA